MSHLPENSRVLLVDDDSISLAQMEIILKRQGIEVHTATDGADGLDVLQTRPAGFFDAVLTDFQMPELNGLELIVKVREIDPTLSTIIITSNSERATISSSLRGGAMDFLEKPVNLPVVTESVTRAIHRSRENRRLQAGSQRLSTVAAIQSRLAPALEIDHISGLGCRLLTRNLPIFEAGGDFLSVSKTTQGVVQLVLGDVSGHGLLEGFIASYFQGMVKGMQSLSATPYAIAASCNRFLLQEWGTISKDEMPSSLSALFVDLDLTRREIRVVNCGCPGVLYLTPGEPLRTLAKHGSPLGWFEDFRPGLEGIKLPDTGAIFVYSDGLPDTAAKAELHTEALLTRLLLTAPGDVALIGRDFTVPDDILAAQLRWYPANRPIPSNRLPVFHATFPGDSGAEIDALHASILRNVRAALPMCSSSDADSITLCIREALLNAFLHGCQGKNSESVTLTIDYLLNQGDVLVAVHDSGPGFSTEPAPPPKKEPDLLDDIGHISLGLRLIRSLASAVRHSHNGSRVEMDFHIEPSPSL